MLWFEAKPNGKWIAEWMKEKLGIEKSHIFWLKCFIIIIDKNK